MGVFNGRTGVYTKGASAPPPFTPASLSGLTLWLDASDAATITQVAGSVSQWNDKSGNGNHVTQGTGANQPITGTNQQNTRNVLTFSNQWLNLPSGPLSVPSAKGTVFVVAKPSNVFGSQALVIWDNGSLRYGIDIYEAYRGWHGNAPGVSSEITVNTNPTILMSGSISGAASTQYVTRRETGTTGPLKTPTTFTGLSAKIGARGTGVETFSGFMAEIVVFSRYLEQAEANSIGGYLADKWGMTWTAIS